jgi:aspartate kinase
MNMESVVIRGISLERDQAKVTIQGLPDLPGVASRVFGVIGTTGVNVDMIVQNVGQDGKARISFTLHKNELKKALTALEELATQIGGGVEVLSDDGIAKLSAVGIGMRSHSGVAATMFEALGAAGINIQMISTSEIKITVTVEQAHADEAARVVHKAFKLHEVSA